VHRHVCGSGEHGRRQRPPGLSVRAIAGHLVPAGTGERLGRDRSRSDHPGHRDAIQQRAGELWLFDGNNVLSGTGRPSRVRPTGHADDRAARVCARARLSVVHRLLHGGGAVRPRRRVPGEHTTARCQRSRAVGDDGPAARRRRPFGSGSLLVRSVRSGRRIDALRRAHLQSRPAVRSGDAGGRFLGVTLLDGADAQPAHGALLYRPDPRPGTDGGPPARRRLVTHGRTEERAGPACGAAHPARLSAGRWGVSDSDARTCLRALDLPSTGYEKMRALQNRTAARGQ
jgi:hypothetical protein